MAALAEALPFRSIPLALARLAVLLLVPVRALAEASKLLADTLLPSIALKGVLAAVPVHKWEMAVTLLGLLVVV